MAMFQRGVTPIHSTVTAATALSQRSTVNGQTIQISAVNGQSGVGQRSNPSAERTKLGLQFAPNLAAGLHMCGMLIS